MLLCPHLLKQTRALYSHGDLMADRGEHVELIVRERAPVSEQQVQDTDHLVLRDEGHGRVAVRLGRVWQGLLQPSTLDKVDRLGQLAGTQHRDASALPGHPAFARH